MARYDYDGETVLLYLTDYDRQLLDSLTEQLIELLTEGQPEPPVSDDPFVHWEADLAAVPEADDPDEVDPAVDRLFPNPYPHDAEAADDYRRFAESDHRRQKVADARVVRGDLAPGSPVRIAEAQITPWLKTLNALRLVLATRLGVEDADAMEDLHQLPDDDPRAMMGAVMDWLAYLQGIIIELTSPGMHDEDED